MITSIKVAASAITFAFVTLLSESVQASEYGNYLSFGVARINPSGEYINSALIISTEFPYAESYGANIAFGIPYSQSGAIEIETAYRDVKIEGSSESFEATSIMLNSISFLDAGNNSPVPYWGAGAGYTFMESESGLSGQVMAGVRLPVMENIDVELEYKYFHFFLETSVDFLEYKSHEFGVGIVFHFGNK